MVATENRFNELEILSQEDLMFEALRKLLDSYKELNRRKDATKQFLKTICALNKNTWVWYILWESGGAQRFSDLVPIAGCSRAMLSIILRQLLKEGLVKRVGLGYQTVSPVWLS